MEPNPFIVEVLTQKLGWTLVHFLWQGAAVAALAEALFYLLRHRSAASRYWTACLIFFGMVALPVVTFCVVHVETPRIVEFQESISRIVAPLPGTSAPRPPEEPSAPISGLSFAEPPPALPTPSVPWHERVASRVQPYLPIMVGIWILGVIALSLRHLCGWVLVQRMKRRCLDPIGERIQQQAAALADRIRISRPVRVFTSTLAAAPLTIGWIRPMILLPAGALTGLTPAQLEAILAHELAHIRRFDYPINLLQTLVETLLFYHPAVWRLSKRIRIERENCCDDIAVEVCGDPVAYAKALAEVADLQTRPALTLGMGDGSLIDRVRRLVGRTHEEEARSSAGWASGVLAVVLLGAVSCIAVPQSELKATENAEEPWKRELSDGFTIELIGVSTHPSAEGSWWTPDGQPMAESPYPPGRDRSAFEKGMTSYEFAYRIPDGEYRSIRWNADGSSSGFNHPEESIGQQIKTLLSASGSFDSQKERVNLRLGVPVGEWKSRHEYPKEQWTGPMGLSDASGSVHFHSPYEREGETVLVVSHNFSRDLRSDAQVVAKTNENKSIRTKLSQETSISGLTSGEYVFDAPQSEIASFEFQTRPLEEAVFEGAALRPDASLPPVSIESVMPIDSGDFEFDSSDLLGRWIGGGGILPVFHTFEEGGVYRSEMGFATGTTDLHEGTWELKGDRLIRDGSEETAARIAEFDRDSFVVEYKDGERWGYRRTLYERVGEGEKEEQTGAVEGRVLIDGKPWTQHRIVYNKYYPDDELPFVQPTKTDSEGFFRVRDLPPGKYHFGVLKSWEVKSGAFSTTTGTHSHGVYVDVVAGETTEIQIGGAGRKVVGKLVPVPDEEGFTPNPQAFEKRFLYGEPPRPKDLQGNIPGDVWIMDIHEDGSFEIPDLRPGDYKPMFEQIDRVEDEDNPIVIRDIHAEPNAIHIPEATEESPAVYDLGEIEVRLGRRLN